MLESAVVEDISQVMVTSAMFNFLIAPTGAQTCSHVIPNAFSPKKLLVNLSDEGPPLSTKGLNISQRVVFLISLRVPRLVPHYLAGCCVAQFVLQELRELSETGIYRSLSLKTISRAASRVRSFMGDYSTMKFFGHGTNPNMSKVCPGRLTLVANSCHRFSFNNIWCTKRALPIYSNTAVVNFISLRELLDVLCGLSK